MDENSIVLWMQSEIKNKGCLYHIDVVSYLIKNNVSVYLQENDNGTYSLSKKILKIFKDKTNNNVVWVSTYKYWRIRTSEDDLERIQ